MHSDTGAEWLAHEGPNTTDEVREVTIKDIYVVGLEELKAVEAHIDDTVARKSVRTLALKCMGIDESDPSLSVPESCSLQLMSDSTTDWFFIDGSF